MQQHNGLANYILNGFININNQRGIPFEMKEK